MRLSGKISIITHHLTNSLPILLHHPHSQFPRHPNPSAHTTNMLRSVVKFTDDSAGLEKTLRLFQSFCTIAVGLAVSAADADFWAKTRGQFALGMNLRTKQFFEHEGNADVIGTGRRYFRLLKWYPCAMNASKALGAEQRLSICTILEITKWSFLAMYFFLEMFTIVCVTFLLMYIDERLIGM